VLDACEAERRLLARELHDGLGSSLVLLQMQLRTALESVPAGNPAAELLDASLDVAASLHRQIRRHALALHPTMLDDLGLVPALRSHTAQLARSTAVPVRFESGGESSTSRWPSAAELSAFRIAQEALANAVRHSQASRISVYAAAGDREMELCIEDDGVGFDLDAARRLSRGRSLGLINMAERARLAGGQLRMSSTPGRGTTVWARFERRRSRTADACG
jgi:signal transduction histidine kinase